MKATKEQQQYINAYIAAHPVGEDSTGMRITKIEQIGDQNAVAIYLMLPTCVDEISVDLSIAEAL